MTDSPEIEKAASEFAKEVKKTFSFRKKLKGITGRTKKVPLFTDLQAVEARETHRQALAKRRGDLVKAERFEGAEDLRAEIVEDIRRLEEADKAFDAEVAAGMVVVHLRSLPNSVRKIADAAVRKDLDIDPGGQIPADKISDYNHAIIRFQLRTMIEKIVDSDGAVEDEINAELIESMEEDLPPTQWVRLSMAHDELMYTDGLENEITDDPGF